MPTPQIIVDLVARFERNIEEYKRAQNETQVRREFIDPFFKALGWDIDNETGAAPQYQDVIHEDQIKIGGRMKAPDYGFRIGGNLKFFVEAKKPSIFVKETPAPAYQVRSYGWSAKLPLSVVTDFEEFAIYDCSQKPKEGDKPSVARVNYYTYKEYIEKWDEIYAVFSKDAIYKGSFDKYALSSKGKRGTTTVDKAFLAEMEEWREKLAKNIAKNNTLTEDQLKFATQRTLDRIIFLRITESRGIEEDERLREAVKGKDAYKNLFRLFEAADNRYNSGLFYFRKGDKAHSSDAELDTITPKLTLDDKVVKDIIESLYYPKSPYQFDVIPADILGQVYEQFLGKVIRMTAGGNVKIEEKPEVRKAGGVYYTPTYIVEYIVKNTVGAVLGNDEGGMMNDESGKKKKNSSFIIHNSSFPKILDPACGSGSFLLGAYDYLLKWYLAEYAKDAKTHLAKKNAPIYAISSGTDFSPSSSERTKVHSTTPNTYALTSAEKKRILLTHIHGVDIDAEAVEVAKLNLMLKCLEGETKQGLKLSLERLLPDLSDNIKCGNSLIGSDFNNGLFSTEENKKINPFDWDVEFPDIMKKGGFDVVIGNPPYILQQILDNRKVFDYFKRVYSAAKYKIDTYHLFIQKGINLLKEGGLFGYITPNTFMVNKFAIELRKYILFNSEVQIFKLFYYQVFKGASVDTSILVTKKVAVPNQNRSMEQVFAYGGERGDDSVHGNIEGWYLMDDYGFRMAGRVGFETDQILADTFEEKAILLKEISTAYFGIQTFDRKSFVSSIKRNKFFKPVIDGTNIQRYNLLPPTEFVEFLPENIKSGGKQFVYEQDRIGIRQIGASPIATIIPAGIYTLNTVYNLYLLEDSQYDLRFILGIINSQAYQWYWKVKYYDHKATFPKIKKDFLLSLPLPNKDEFRRWEKYNYSDHMCIYVQQMLDLNKELQSETLPKHRVRINQELKAVDKKIDSLVYELQSLMDNEVSYIEGTYEY